MTLSTPPALELTQITKQFDGRPALQGASFNVRQGEVHALLGENGAGKSTLMNIACGLYAPDSGILKIDGNTRQIVRPAQATALGVGMVHQHYKLVKRFTVTENIQLACGEALGLTSQVDISRHAEEKCREFGLEIDANARVEDISVAEQQRVEILKMLLLGARILILDEPTAVLTDQESEVVLSLIRSLAKKGAAVVLITHKLREVMAFSDRVTVMRGGETTLSGANTSELSREDLAMAMVGNESTQVKFDAGTSGDVVLEVAGLTKSGHGGRGGIEEIGFQVQSGEIFGIAGVGGNGQAELADVLMGMTEPGSGEIRLSGQSVASKPVAKLRDLGMRFIPADRFKSGLISDLRSDENLVITELASGRFGSWFWVNRSAIRDAAELAINERNILGCAPHTLARLLSGGNAQKLLLARELGDNPLVIIAHSPTRGLDVQACNTVHQLLVDAVRSGAGCVLISEDLEEILSLSTTIAVMSHGRFAGMGKAGEITREQIGSMMLGHA